jgi:PIN domain
MQWIVGTHGHDVSMLITPRIGANRSSLLQQLLQVETDLKNVRGRAQGPVDLFNEYLRWANEAVRMLRQTLREADLERLVLTRRYWTMQAMATGPVGMAANLVEVEIDDRTTAFETALRTTEAEFKRWDERGRLVVADTSFFHRHSDKLDEADLSKVIGSREAPISLVVPMVIIDELEKQKNASQKDLRWRAAVTLAVIERVAGHTGFGRLREADFSALDHGEIPSGDHWIDVLFDLPGHVRLSINDDEIVDRALAVQLLSAKPVTFLTYDTNQALRARHAGIDTVMKLRKDHDESAS